MAAGLGARLPNRTTRRVALTEAGRAYHPRCVALLAQFDDLRADMREERTRPRGLLTVAGPVTFGALHLAPAIHAFAQARPEVSADPRLTDRFVDLIEEGVDMAVRIGRLEDSAMVARRLGDGRAATGRWSRGDWARRRSCTSPRPQTSRATPASWTPTNGSRRSGRSS